MHDDYPRHLFEGAKTKVESAQKPKAKELAIGCGALGCSAVIVLGGVTTLALVGFKNPLVLGAAVIVGVIPYSVYLLSGRNKSAEALLGAMHCPDCRGATALDKNVPRDCYVLVCHSCHIVWETELPLPGPGDATHSPHTPNIN